MAEVLNKDNENEDEKCKEFDLTNDAELQNDPSENDTGAAVCGDNSFVALFAELASGSKEEILSEVPEEDKPIFNVMPPVKMFTGRTDELNKLHKKLQTTEEHGVVSHCAAISGLGGMGKSELARKYAWEYRELYKHIIWINCEKKLDTWKSFRKLAEDLKILKPSPGDDENKSDLKGLEKDLQSILPKIYKRVVKARTLLIFDNVDKFKDIKNFLPLNLTPAEEKLAIIITSRNSDWDIGEEGSVDVILLNQFTPHEATKFVKQSLQISDEDKSYDDLISELIEMLCCFPLALHQAVSCIMTKSSLNEGIQEYLNEFRDEETKRNLLKWSLKHDRYTETTYTTWQVTFKNIKNKEPSRRLAIFLVEVMSYLAPGDISAESIMRGVVDQQKLEKAIDILVKYSIITVHQNNVANIHSLVQLVVRLWLEYHEKQEKVLKVILNRVYEFLDESHIAPFLSYICDSTTLMDEYFRISCMNNYFFDCFETAFDHHVENGNVCTVRNILDYLELKQDSWPRPYREIFHAKGVNCHPKIVANGSKEDVERERHTKNVYLFHAEVKKALRTSKTEDLEEFLQSFDKSLINSWLCGCTALHKSVKVGNLDVINMLINNRADVNFRNIHDDYPLNMALEKKYPKVAGYLLDKGADPNPHADRSGRKPIHYAAMFGHLNIMPLLANTKEDFENRSKDDWTPLHFAAGTDQLEIVEFLISKGVDVTAMTEEGVTACDIAVRKGSIRVVKYMIDNQLVDVSLRNGKNETLLHTAVEHEHIDIVKYLLSFESRAKEHINAFDDWGVTPLFLAVANSNIEIVKLLIQHGASVDNVKNETTLLGKLKLSALPVAAALNNLEIAKILIEESKADINMGLDTSASPLQIAKTFNSTEVRDFLLEKGADESKKDNSENIGRILRSFFVGRDADDYMYDVNNLTLHLLKCDYTERCKQPRNKTLEDRSDIIQTYFLKLSLHFGMILPVLP